MNDSITNHNPPGHGASSVGSQASATLKIVPLLDGSRRITIGCEHGTTLGGDLRTAPLTEAATVAFMVQRHRRGTNCHCAGELERQYPAALIPADLMVAEISPGPGASA